MLSVQSSWSPQAKTTGKSIKIRIDTSILKWGAHLQFGSGFVVAVGCAGHHLERVEPNKKTIELNRQKRNQPMKTPIINAHRWPPVHSVVER